MTNYKPILIPEDDIDWLIELVKDNPDKQALHAALLHHKVNPVPTMIIWRNEDGEAAMEGFPDQSLLTEVTPEGEGSDRVLVQQTAISKDAEWAESAELQQTIERVNDYIEEKLGNQ